MLIFRKAKPFGELNQEAPEINLNIRKLVLNKHCFDGGLEEKIGVVVKINTLREQLARVQRETRMRGEDEIAAAFIVLPFILFQVSVRVIRSPSGVVVSS